GFLDEGFQPIRGAFETAQKEMVDGGITTDELRRMQIPALEETVAKRMHVVIEPEPPRAMDGFAILPDLIAGQRLAFAGAMRADGENVRCAVGEMNASAGHRDEHDLPREIARRMPHRLM